MHYLKDLNSQREHALNKPTVSLGKHPENDIVIVDDILADFQVEIYTGYNLLMLNNLDDAESVLINQKLAKGNNLINIGDILLLGSTSFVVVNEEENAGLSGDTVLAKPSHPNESEATQLHQFDAIEQAPSPQWSLVCTDQSVDDISLPEQTKFILGRAQHCDAMISAGLLSRTHAEIFVNGDEVRIRDLNSSNGSFVNQSRITSCVIHHGDIIRLGDLEFQLNRLNPPQAEAVTKFTDASSADAETQKFNIKADEPSSEDVWQAPPTTTDGTVIIAGTPKYPYLRGISAPITGKTFDLAKPLVTLGRAPDNDICINDASVSSHHAKLVRQYNKWLLTDLNSTNGTFVHNTRIKQAQLEGNETVRLGSIDLAVENLGDSRSPVTSSATIIPENTTFFNKNSVLIFSIIGLLIISAIAASVFYFNKNKTEVSQIEPLSLNFLWQRKLPGEGVLTAPVIQNINNEKSPEVILSDDNGYTFVLNGSSGKDLFAVKSEGSRVFSSTADLSANRLHNLIISSNGGNLKVVDQVGNLLWEVRNKPYIENFINHPDIRDINGDGQPDIIAPTLTHGLVAINGKDGSLLWDSKKHTLGKVLSQAVVDDINGDGVVDFISLSNVGQLLATTYLNDKLRVLWSVDVGPVLFASPLLVDFRGSKYIIVATHKQGIYAIDAKTAKIRWQVKSNKSFFATPFLNGQELGLVSYDGSLMTLDIENGSEIAHKSLSTFIQADPKFRDINGDNVQEFFIVDTSGNLFIIDGKTKYVIFSTAIANANRFLTSPALGDINQNGLLDIVFTTPKGKVLAYEINRSF